MNRNLYATQLAVADLGSAALALLEAQKHNWPLAGANYAALVDVCTRDVAVDGLKFRLQFNPKRIVSSNAKVDAASIAGRACFLCEANLPPQQTALVADDEYRILVNPFPILPAHFTVPHLQHKPQAIAGPTFTAMAKLTVELAAAKLFVFYNGPRCGASAPDHLHFQAGCEGVLPIEHEIDALMQRFGRQVLSSATVVACPLRPFLVIQNDDLVLLAQDFARIVEAWADVTQSGNDEPLLNVLTSSRSGALRVLVFPRTRHRPSFFFAEGDDRIMLSPASLDLGGLCVAPVERDFDRITPELLRQMLQEVCPPPNLFESLVARL